MANTIREMLSHYPWITNNIKFVIVLLLALIAYFDLSIFSTASNNELKKN